MRGKDSSPLILLVFSLLLCFQVQQKLLHAVEPPHRRSAGKTISLWARTFGSARYDALRGNSSLFATSDGGYIFAGQTIPQNPQNPDDYFDILVIKIDSDGNIQWQRVYATDQEDAAYGGIHETTDGGYRVLGFTMPARWYGNHVLWVLKLTPNGDIEWQQTYGTDYGIDVPRAFNLTNDGGCIISGYTYSYGTEKIWILKLDSSGNIEWQRTYGGNHIDESGNSIHQTDDGGFIVAGSTWSFGAGDGDYCVLKLDSSGDIEWQRAYGGEGLDFAHGIQVASDGGYIVVGRTETFGAGGTDCWILKLSHYGDIEWQRAYGGGDWDSCAAVVEDHNSGYVFVGGTNSFGAGGVDQWVVKIDPHGDILWQRTYGGRGDDYSWSIERTRDGGYVYAGATRSINLGAGRQDILILKLSAEGTIGESCEIMGSSAAQVTETFVSPSDTNFTPNEAQLHK